jgi:esterase/lipase superfamily enzyme
MKSKLYPVRFHDETRHVTVPGSSGEEPGPASEHEFATFLGEAVEAYAEASNMLRPRIRVSPDAGVLAASHGFVVRIGAAEFRITIVQSR